ncbi:MAG: sigma factor, partial [Thermoplasmatales archaeon]
LYMTNITRCYFNYMTNMPKSGKLSNKELLELVRKVEGMISKEVSKYWVSEFMREDLMQAGRMGALEAFLRYDERKKSSKTTYAYYWIRKRVREEALKWTNIIKHETPLDTIVDDRDDEMAILVQLEHGMYTSHSPYENVEDVIESISSGTIRRALRLMAVYNMTISEVSIALGIRRQYIFAYIKKAGKQKRRW